MSAVCLLLSAQHEDNAHLPCGSHMATWDVKRLHASGFFTALFKPVVNGKI
jgi:hypothetical protein